MHWIWGLGVRYVKRWWCRHHLVLNRRDRHRMWRFDLYRLTGIIGLLWRVNRFAMAKSAIIHNIGKENAFHALDDSAMDRRISKRCESVASLLMILRSRYNTLKKEYFNFESESLTSSSETPWLRTITYSTSPNCSRNVRRVSSVTKGVYKLMAIISKAMNIKHKWITLGTLSEMLRKYTWISPLMATWEAAKESKCCSLKRYQTKGLRDKEHIKSGGRRISIRSCTSNCDHEDAARELLSMLARHLLRTQTECNRNEEDNYDDRSRRKTSRSSRNLGRERMIRGPRWCMRKEDLEQEESALGIERKRAGVRNGALCG